MKLSSLVNLRGTNIDVDITIIESEEMKVCHPVLPTSDSNTFLTFPFKECAQRINLSTEGLTIIDHPFFKFQCDGEELCNVHMGHLSLQVYFMAHIALSKKMPQANSTIYGSMMI